jgi:hypothetical protein
VYAERTENGIEWRITIDTALLDEGSVFDPSQPWGLGWRCIDSDNEAELLIDGALVTDLKNRLNAKIEF